MKALWRKAIVYIVYLWKNYQISNYLLYTQIVNSRTRYLKDKKCRVKFNDASLVNWSKCKVFFIAIRLFPSLSLFTNLLRDDQDDIPGNSPICSFSSFWKSLYWEVSVQFLAWIENREPDKVSWVAFILDKILFLRFSRHHDRNLNIR